MFLRWEVEHFQTDLVLSECSCLIGANDVDAAHSLTSRDISHEVIIFNHFFRGISKRYSDSERESFWDARDSRC